MAWLTDVLERIVSGRAKANALEALLPWNWRPVPANAGEGYVAAAEHAITRRERVCSAQRLR